MRPQPKHKIASMLTDAYSRLGVNSVREIEAKIKEALAYLYADREHYIEVVDPDTPEYYITIQNGRLCKLIPLAREVIRDQETDHVKEYTAIFSLMLSDTGNRFVYSYSHAKRYSDPTQNAYGYPVYRYAELGDIRKTLQVLSPYEIRPVATNLDWEAFGMMFTAFAHLNRSKHINTIPHKTERAMLAAAYAQPKELTVDGKNIRGKLIPLAQEESMWEEMREDHRYRYKKELCLLITPEKPYYLMSTRHIYSYFRKVIFDDVPGGCAYEPTEEKQETTYAFAALADINQDMHPLYY